MSTGFLKKYKCPLIEMSYEESEMTKAFINIYLATFADWDEKYQNYAYKVNPSNPIANPLNVCLLYTSDAADE